MGLVQDQSTSIETGAEFLTIKISSSFGCPEKVRQINLYPWSLFCTLTRFFGRECSTTLNSPFWNVGNECIGLTSSSWSQVCFHHPSFLLQIYCWEIVPQHPSSRDFSLLMRLLPSLALKVLFCLVPSFFWSTKELNSISLDYLQNIFIFRQFFKLPRKCTNLNASGTVRIFDCTTIVLPIDVLTATLLVISIAEFL